MNTLFNFLPLVILIILLVLTVVVDYIPCKNCPLKKECDKGVKAGGSKICKKNISFN